MLSNSYQYGLPSDNKMLNRPINYSECDKIKSIMILLVALRVRTSKLDSADNA
jgi:hypothetical protein